jgi:hypothetical protein
MARPATLLCSMAAAPWPASPRRACSIAHPPRCQRRSPGPSTRAVLADAPSAGERPRHTDGGTTAEFFGRLTGMVFACLAFDAPRRRIRRAEVVCARDSDSEEWFGYAGGWPKGRSVFIVDRIRVGSEGSAELLGGAQVGVHVREVLGPAESPRPVVTVQDTAVR